jgi:hypothetical protein
MKRKIIVRGIAIFVFYVLMSQQTVFAATDHPRILLNNSKVSSMIQQKVASNESTWVALKNKCDNYIAGGVQLPGGDSYPNGSIGRGYMGEGYFTPLLNLGSCFQAMKSQNSSLADKYASKGIEVLMAMSSVGKSAQNISEDSVYGIRFYGVGMALGYDWLNEKMSAPQKTQVYTALNTWISTYETKGFGRNHPQGNYYAGYYAAKALTALATEGENPQATAMWNSWLNEQHNSFVQPYYEKWLKGGGWPEGWNYGPLATMNMTWPVIAAQTAKGIDLIHNSAHPFSFPEDQGAYLMHFAWPNQKSLDDRGEMKNSENPSQTRPGLYNFVAGFLNMINSPLAPSFHSYAAAVREAVEGGRYAWEDFLFWDASAPSQNYSSQPLSLVTSGMNEVAVRSSWSSNAIWASFTSGPYINNPDSGEEFYDQGSLAITKGGTAFLVNTPGAMLRMQPGEKNFWQNIYDENYSDNGYRSIYNIFYPGKKGQAANDPDVKNPDIAPKTRLTRFSDQGSYVAFTGENIQDMYLSRDVNPVTLWNRDVVYVRPDVFVVFDHTIINTTVDQYQAFHLAKTPAEVTAPDAESHRIAVNQNSAYVGSVTTLYPKNNAVKLVNVFGSNKIYRLEVRPATSDKEQYWLTVLDAAGSSADVKAERLIVSQGDAVGAILKTTNANTVVAFAKNETQNFNYSIPNKKTHHIISGLKAGTYKVAAASSGGNVTITVLPGGNISADQTGRISFVTEENSTIVQPDSPSAFPIPPTSNPIPSNPPPTTQPPVTTPPLTPLPDTTKNTVFLYRLWNKSLGNFYFTTNKAELDALVKNKKIWEYRGVAEHVFALNNCAESDKVQIRLFASNNGKRLIYTKNQAEINFLTSESQSKLWKDRGAVFCGYRARQTNSMPVYRFRNPYTQMYSYEIFADRQQALKKAGWKQESISYYAFPSDKYTK